MEGEICVEQLWNDAQLFVAATVKCLGNVVKERYVILLLDGHRCHIHQSVLNRMPAALWNPIVLRASSHDG